MKLFIGKCSQIILCATVIVLLQCTSAYAQKRVKQSLNDSWKYWKGDPAKASGSNYPDSLWAVVQLPHTWNDKDVLSDGARGYYRGPGWYRKKIRFKPEFSSRKHYLYFEGANQVSDVYINGNHAGQHKGGYTAFCFDITPWIKFGDDNVVAVRVDNSHHPDIPPLSADFTFYGGIYRDVFLISTSQIHFDMLDHASGGVYIETPQVSKTSASVKIRARVINELPSNKKVTIKTVIKNRDGIEVSSVLKKITINANALSEIELFCQLTQNIQLWSPAYPYLYSTETSIIENGMVADNITTSLGLRWFKFDPEKGFYLNGEPLKLTGANRHQDYLGKGNALSDDQHRRDLALLKSMGGNFIRLAHYPQDPAVLDETDKLGLVVWEEIPLVNEVTISKGHHENSATMLREMIRQHYNHPSIVLWGYMNEIYWMHRFLPADTIEAHTRETLALAKNLEVLTRKEDPTRYTGMALHNYPLYQQTGLDTISQVTGWNLYHGWYYDKYEDFGKFLDDFHTRNPRQPIIISEYGAGADERLHSMTPEKFDFTTEGQKLFYQQIFPQILARPFVAGSSIWNLIDFGSERRIDATPHINNKGILTAAREPKDVYFYYQAALSNKPILKIAETNWTYRSGYASNSIDKEAQQTVQVFTNLPEAELFMNGKSLGRKKTENYEVVWNTNFSDGDHLLSVRSEQNGQVYEDYLSITFHLLPFDLKKNPFTEIAINAGCSYDYYEPGSRLAWVYDKKYTPGSWGYIGGKPLYIANKIGTKEDILGTDDDPLYQTMRIGAQGYRFDVTDGEYEIELLWVEPYPQSRRFVDGHESPHHPGGQRIFDVAVNDKVVLESFDLLKTYGYNRPVRKKFYAECANGSGLTITFTPVKGEATISALKVRRLK